MKVPEEVKRAIEDYHSYDAHEKVKIVGDDRLIGCARKYDLYLVEYWCDGKWWCEVDLYEHVHCTATLAWFDIYDLKCEDSLIREMLDSEREMDEEREICEIEEIIGEENEYQIKSDIGTEWEK